ncbi:MAG: tRNA (adenosine(37)-N6)-threonylcarbamoyltransferase complex dimerization subunit type 1 TsaB [bacterium]|nr:tRNA (adenosine(37)-N6)-threonylcarbamoyltransferase complex dimerization subunit type 1 TsaB [bacterium]
MNVLSIETTSDRASAAYMKDCEIISQRIIKSRLSSGKTLLDSVREIFADTGIFMKDIDFAVCGTGPGSFTGIRLGISFVKGVSSGSRGRIKTCGIIANDVIAHACFSGKMNKDMKIAALIDSKTGCGFVREYSEKAEPLGEIRLLAYDEIGERYKEHFFAGIFSEKFARMVENKKNICPDAAWSARLFLQRPAARVELKPAYMMDFKPGGPK